jgi:DNA-binding CsgD family transcriptional regulator
VALHERAGRLHEQLGQAPGVAWSQYDRGLLAHRRGHLDGAAAHLSRALARFREMAHGWGIGCSSCALGAVRLEQRRLHEAAALVGEALERFEAVGDQRGLAQCLEAAAALAFEHDAPRDAELLLGAASALRQRLAAPLTNGERQVHDALTQRLSRALGPADADRAWSAGRALTPAAVLALAGATLGLPEMARPAVPLPSLTPREQQVAVLVASGRTNRQIGRELGIAEKTTEVHVHNIIRKLGARSRAEVAARTAADET